MPPAFYAMVPATVRYDRELSPNAILLYMEISAAMDRDGVARQKSKYYMEIFRTSRELVMKWLKELKDKGHIQTFTEDGAFGISFERVTPVPVPVPEPKMKLTVTEEDKLVIQWVIDEYHRICTKMPKVRAITDARRKAIRVRFAEAGKSKAAFTEVFTKAMASSFLLCLNPGQKWKADFDFLISPGGFAKTLEGKYDDSKSAGRTAPDDDEL